MGLEQLRPTSALAAKPVLPAAMHRLCSPARTAAPGQQRASCGICGGGTRRCAAGGCHPRLAGCLREQIGQESIGERLHQGDGCGNQTAHLMGQDGQCSWAAALHLRAYRTLSLC